jgi:hypothetical protein
MNMHDELREIADRLKELQVAAAAADPENADCLRFAASYASRAADKCSKEIFVY